MVQLQRKMAFPFVTVIMTLLAVPFAVTTGRRGALGGIGIGIAISIVYWVILSVFGALGEGGVTTPTLAAWAPNILFGAAARLHGASTVRHVRRRRQRSSARVRTIHTRPDVPGLVLIGIDDEQDGADLGAWRLVRAGAAGRRQVVEKHRPLLIDRVDVDRPLPAPALRAELDGHAASAARRGP